MIEIKECVCMCVCLCLHCLLAKSFCSEICLSFRVLFLFHILQHFVNAVKKKNGEIQCRVKLLDFTVDLLKCSACDPPFKVERSSESEAH